MVKEKGFGDKLVDLIIYSILALLALSCLLPFMNVLATSLSGASAVNTGKVTFWPVDLTLDNYRFLMGDRQIIRSFVTSVNRVLLGVSLTVLMCVITAYPLSRDHIHMPGRTIYKFILIFSMLFSGGLIPFFLTIRQLGLFDRFLVLILPGIFNSWLTILVINFFRGIPRELEEAAVLDGASHFDVLFRVFLPISTPVLATVSLFSAVGHWNSWFDGFVFLRTRELWPLQSYLFAQIPRGGVGADLAQLAVAFENATPEALIAALIVFTSIPILLVYPLLQRYFVTGLTLGSLKE